MSKGNSEFARVKLENDQLKKYINQLEAQIEQSNVAKLSLAIEFVKAPLFVENPRREEVMGIITTALIGAEKKEKPTEDVTEFEKAVAK